MTSNSSKRDKVAFVLQLLFYVLVVVMLIVFFLYRNSDTPRLFIIPAVAALVVRIASYVLRYFNR